MKREQTTVDPEEQTRIYTPEVMFRRLDRQAKRLLKAEKLLKEILEEQGLLLPEHLRNRIQNWFQDA